MKKYVFPILISISISLSFLAIAICATTQSQNYVVPGYYYGNNTVVTNDGNIWGYETEMPDGAVHVVFNDNGTETIYDDIIIDLIKSK